VVIFLKSKFSKKNFFKIGYSKIKIKNFPEILFTASCPLYRGVKKPYGRGVTGEGVRRGVYMGEGLCSANIGNIMQTTKFLTK